VQKLALGSPALQQLQDVGNDQESNDKGEPDNDPDRDSN
jgi:hypothetical protein